MSLMTDLEYYWTLDDTLVDMVSGKVFIPTTPGGYVGGKIGNGWKVNGVNRLANQSLLLPISGDFTIAGWLNVDSLALPGFSYALSILHDSNLRLFLYLLYVGALSSSTFTVGAFGVSTSVIVNGYDTNWHQFIVTFNSGDMTTYWDGVSVLGKTIGQTADGLAGELHYGWVTGSFWPGSVDELGFWSRGFDAADVAELWNSGNGWQPTELSSSSSSSSSSLSSVSTSSSTGVVDYPDAKTISITGQFSASIAWPQ